MNIQKFKQASKARRKARARSRIFGTLERPRFTVRRSLKNIYAQIIDDAKGITLAAASGLEIKAKKKNTKAAAAEVGAILAKKAKEKGITKVAFDKSFYTFHGRIQALAQAARDGGLEF